MSNTTQTSAPRRVTSAQMKMLRACLGSPQGRQMTMSGGGVWSTEKALRDAGLLEVVWVPSANDPTRGHRETRITSAGVAVAS